MLPGSEQSWEVMHPTEQRGREKPGAEGQLLREMVVVVILDEETQGRPPAEDDI